MSDDGLMSGRESPLGLIRRAHTAAYFYLSFLAIYELIWLPLHVHRVSFHFLFFLFYFYFYFIFIFVFIYFFFLYLFYFIFIFFLFYSTLCFDLLFPLLFYASRFRISSPFFLLVNFNIVLRKTLFFFTSMGLLAANGVEREKKKLKHCKHGRKRTHNRKFILLFLFPP